MYIKECTVEDVSMLAVLNKQLIEDEKSDNPLMIPELEESIENSKMGPRHFDY